MLKGMSAVKCFLCLSFLVSNASTTLPGFGEKIPVVLMGQGCRGRWRRTLVKPKAFYKEAVFRL
jgi:hypothetical protein